MEILFVGLIFESVSQLQSTASPTSVLYHIRFRLRLVSGFHASRNLTEYRLGGPNGQAIRDIGFESVVALCSMRNLLK